MGVIECHFVCIFRISVWLSHANAFSYSLLCGTRVFFAGCETALANDFLQTMQKITAIRMIARVGENNLCRWVMRLDRVSVICDDVLIPKYQLAMTLFADGGVTIPIVMSLHIAIRAAGHECHERSDGPLHRRKCPSDLR